MGVRLLSRWARGAVRGMGLGPGKRPVCDARTSAHVAKLIEWAKP